LNNAALVYLRLYFAGLLARRRDIFRAKCNRRDFLPLGFAPDLTIPLRLRNLLAEGEEAVLNLLQRLKQERGLTFVLVSHNLSVVAHMCDDLAVMNHGAVVEELAVAQLKRREP